jgi:hypothetical protein
MSDKIIITPKDIQRMVGYCYKTSAKMHRQIRQYCGKAAHQFVTMEDFCAFTGLTLENAGKMLRDG